MATRYESKVAIRTFMKSLATTMRASKLPKKNAYVFNIWGTARRAPSTHIRAYMKRYADKYGLTYVEVPVFSNRWLVDRTHPSSKGSKEIARRVMAASNIEKR